MAMPRLPSERVQRDHDNLWAPAVYHLRAGSSEQSLSFLQETLPIPEHIPMMSWG